MSLLDPAQIDRMRSLQDLKRQRPLTSAEASELDQLEAWHHYRGVALGDR